MGDQTIKIEFSGSALAAVNEVIAALCGEIASLTARVASLEARPYSPSFFNGGPFGGAPAAPTPYFIYNGPEISRLPAGEMVIYGGAAGGGMATAGINDHRPN